MVLKKTTLYIKERIGAYGIGFSKEGKIPVIMKSLADGNKRYYLLGGGIENGETQEECLKRECLEEVGLS